MTRLTITHALSRLEGHDRQFIKLFEHGSQHDELFRMDPEELIVEYENLPLKESVLEKWLYHNAARFFRIG